MSEATRSCPRQISTIFSTCKTVAQWNFQMSELAGEHFLQTQKSTTRISLLHHPKHLLLIRTSNVVVDTERPEQVV
ncbi:hypothetical protein HBH98_012300 [Parastagonospora nodorum]|nr:hypothetical protein HBH53_005990 [Parastagonospora nodorum]KAH3976835.1 hypothetical protein HBH51_075520 [Parastagonospora nodorum]KAH3982251.1 hypothetical protein HBH52_078950 [Parastagonospora nodorum]KAH4069180.1 hypothetical protein HBH50_109900 [Parastagonospora nodorum]KAH4088250.1 hypothetical protein HBH48_126870 [Parastagonospora nodorum]